MANKPIVIIHGWSDQSESFQPLALRLAEETNQAVSNIWLGDYLSLDDDVKLEDISRALQRAWVAAGLPVARNQVDVVIHSTGGLVIRHWMHKNYTAKGLKPPIQNLVMLAPANFGSPLAHKGRAIIGRAIKGFGSGFETGAHILKALEMASPYTWELAEHDRFGPNVFSNGGVRCTVIVGNSGYSGISGLANEDGSDGTVYVSTASLNCARITLTVQRKADLPEDGEDQIESSKLEQSNGLTALLVMNDFDHGSITGKGKLSNKKDSELIEGILRGLQVNSRDFKAWVKQCDEKTNAVYARYAKRRDAEKHAFQNTVFRVRDDQGGDVDDYVIEFYGEFDKASDFWARVFNRDISGKTHAYGDNASYRSFMIDVTRLWKELDQADEALKISISALPDVMDEKTKVGYKTSGADHIGAIILGPEAMREYFAPNRTLLVDVVLPRYQKAAVAELKSLD